MKKKGRSKKIKNVLDTLFFYFITFISIGGLVLYLWVYTKIDKSMYALEIQKLTLEELLDEINVLQSDIDALSKPNIVSEKVREKWKMETAYPESIEVYISSNNLKTL